MRAGLNNLLQMMEGMTKESGSCTTSACGAACPSGTSPISSSAAGCGRGAARSRCCPTAAYPDVLLLVDRGVATCILGEGLPIYQADYSSYYPSLDASKLLQRWSSAKELLLLPGGRLQLLRDHDELNMSSAAVMSAFLRRALTLFPQASSGRGREVGGRRMPRARVLEGGGGVKGRHRACKTACQCLCSERVCNLMSSREQQRAHMPCICVSHTHRIHSATASICWCCGTMAEAGCAGGGRATLWTAAWLLLWACTSALACGFCLAGAHAARRDVNTDV